MIIAQEIGSKPHDCHFFAQHGQTIYESVSRNQRRLQNLPNQCSHEGLRHPEHFSFSILLFKIFLDAIYLSSPQGHLHCSFPEGVELRSPLLSDTEASISNYLRAGSISVLVLVIYNYYLQLSFTIMWERGVSQSRSGSSFVALVASSYSSPLLPIGIVPELDHL